MELENIYRIRFVTSDNKQHLTQLQAIDELTALEYLRRQYSDATITEIEELGDFRYN